MVHSGVDLDLTLQRLHESRVAIELFLRHLLDGEYLAGSQMRGFVDRARCAVTHLLYIDS